MPALKTIALPATFAFLLLGVIAILAGNGITEDSFSLIIRMTATSSMILFSLAFSASSIHQLLGDSRWRPVLQARRRLGLSFALSHTAHLLAIIALVELFHGGDYSQLGDIVGGSVIYLFIFAMAATSNDASVRRLGKGWKVLHKTGAYLVWFGLFSTYIGKALETGALHYWLFFLLGAGLVLLRIWAFLDKRSNA